VIHAYDIYGIIKQICTIGYYKTDVFNVCVNGILTSHDIVKFMKDEIFSKAHIELKGRENAVAHIISNKKLLTIYSPMDIKESLRLYIKEMLGHEKGKDEKRLNFQDLLQI
jgi:hypothetical protein